MSHTVIFWNQYGDLLFFFLTETFLFLCFTYTELLTNGSFSSVVLFPSFILSVCNDLSSLGLLAWTHCHGPLPLFKQYHLRLSLTFTGLNCKLFLFTIRQAGGYSLEPFLGIKNRMVSLSIWNITHGWGTSVSSVSEVDFFIFRCQ